MVQFDHGQLKGIAMTTGCFAVTRARAQLILLAGSLVIAGCPMRPSPLLASLSQAAIVVRYNEATIRSTSVTTIAIVTSGTSSQASYIECYFQTATGQVGLRLETSDQRRIEAFYQQIVTAAAGGQQFQITAYSKSTYQPDGYIANLDSGLVYLILS